MSTETLAKALRDLAEIDFDNVFVPAARMLETQAAELAALKSDMAVYVLACSEQATEIEALRKDAERLDWLYQKLFVSKWNGVIDSGSSTSWHIAGDYRHTTVKMDGATFRDAIDAAMQTKEES